MIDRVKGGRAGKISSRGLRITLELGLGTKWVWTTELVLSGVALQHLIWSQSGIWISLEEKSLKVDVYHMVEAPRSNNV